MWLTLKQQGILGGGLGRLLFSLLLLPANGEHQRDQPTRGRTLLLADRAGSMGARCIYHPRRPWQVQGQHGRKDSNLSSEL